MSQSKSALDCLNSFLPFWRARGFSTTDINIISHFLFIHGLFKELIQINMENIEKDDPVSWFYLGKALQNMEPNLKSPVYDKLKHYIIENRKLDEFTVSDLFERLFPNETEIKFQQLQQKMQIKERLRQTLLDQIRVFNHSRNYNIEKQTIQKFKKFFPNDKLANELLSRFEMEDLQRFFQRYQNENKKVSIPVVKKFSQAEIDLIEKYYSSALSEPIENWEGYIYLFIFIDAYEYALKLVTQLPPSESMMWLHMELLLLNRKFAEGLSFVNSMELKFKEDPLFFKSKVYYVAQCFWGLGEHKKALELMQNLAEVHPDFRLTSSFLKEWKSEL